MWLVGVIVFFIYPISNPPFLVTEASLSKSPFLPPLISPPPPLNLWSCSSRSAQSDKTLLLCFSCGEAAAMSELAAPLANPFSRLSTREQLQPILPKYHDKVIEITIWNPPRARSRQISSTEISKLIKTSSSSASSQRVIFWPHRTSHPQESSHIQVHCKPCLFSRAQLTALPLRPAPAPSSRVTVNCSQAAELGGRGGRLPEVRSQERPPRAGPSATPSPTGRGRAAPCPPRASAPLT